MIKNKLKLNTKNNKQTSIEKRLFYSFSAILVSLFFVYIYSIGSITFNLIEKKNIENQIGNLNSNVSNLELEYLNLANNIDLELASTLGLKEVKKVSFVNRQALVSNNFIFE